MSVDVLEKTVSVENNIAPALAPLPRILTDS